jgi:hypothetical protein
MADLDQAAADQGAANNTADETAAAAATAEATEAGAGDAAGSGEGDQGGEQAAPTPVTGIPAEGFADAAARDAFLESQTEEQLATALDYYREHGEWPTAEAAPDATAAKADDTETKAADTETTAGEPGTALEPFKFTENADPDTFKAEKTAWLDTVEVSPELETVLSFQDNRIAELETQIAENPLINDPTAVDHIAAFNKLVTFRLAPELDPVLNVHVPDTTGVIDLLEKQYPQELPRLIEDLNSQPSPKYTGYTRLQEFMRDTFDLSAAAMGQINYFLVNKGQIPMPSYVPPGIHASLVDAFWSAEDREALADRVEKAQFALFKDPDSTPAEKESAQAELRAINNRLDREQKGIDAAKTTRQYGQTQQQKTNAEIAAEGEKSFFQTTTNLVSQFSEKLSKALPMLDEAGSGLTGLSMATLVEKALTDDAYHSKFAQEKIKEMGITFDWSRGRAALDQLWDKEIQIAALKKGGANARAITIAETEKLGIVKQLENLETELSGKIVARVVTGNSNKVAKQMAAAPKQPAAKKKVAGDSAAGAAPTTWEELSYEEGEKRLADLRLKRATQGDFGGFE